MSEVIDGSLLSHFSDLPDLRIERTKKHKLIDIVAIAIYWLSTDYAKARRFN